MLAHIVLFSFACVCLCVCELYLRIKTVAATLILYTIFYFSAPVGRLFAMVTSLLCAMWVEVRQPVGRQHSCAMPPVTIVIPPRLSLLFHRNPAIRG